MIEPVRPTYIGVGGHKCASTWISECLRDHPEVFVSTPKELGFFSWHFKKGLAWYLSHFESAGSFEARGEFTSHYLYDPKVPQRIRDSLGKVKIIVVVRDPVSRALSQVSYGIRHRLISPLPGQEVQLDELKAMIKEYPAIVERSLYFHGINRFLQLFGPESVLVLEQSDCQTRPDAVLRKVWMFLGVNSDFLPSRATKEVSKGTIPSWHWLETMRIRIFYWANRNCPKVITLARKHRIGEMLRKINAGRHIEFSPESEAYLKERFDEDWKKTQRLVCPLQYDDSDRTTAQGL